MELPHENGTYDGLAQKMVNGMKKRRVVDCSTQLDRLAEDIVARHLMVHLRSGCMYQFYVIGQERQVMMNNFIAELYKYGDLVRWEVRHTSDGECEITMFQRESLDQVASLRRLTIEVAQLRDDLSRLRTELDDRAITEGQ
jgi:hypothetical protein